MDVPFPISLEYTPECQSIRLGSTVSSPPTSPASSTSAPREPTPTPLSTAVTPRPAHSPPYHVSGLLSPFLNNEDPWSLLTHVTMVPWPSGMLHMEEKQ